MVIWLWIGFIVFVLVMLALDLGVFNREAHVISTPEALRWTGLCVVLALAFTVFVYFAYEHHLFGIGLHHSDVKSGWDGAVKFLAGYIVEQSLSLDNIFVIALIFSYFRIPRVYQHRVLFWGIIGALIMRGAMIILGTQLLEHFRWMIYVFGGLLIVTAVKMMSAGEEPPEPDRNILVRIARKFYPVARELEGEKFFTQVPVGDIAERGFPPTVSETEELPHPVPIKPESAPNYSGGAAGTRRAMTPMFVCLLVIESTDVLFAIDSIPAIFAITRDPFIVFTSNVFAILCLRSMFFALSGMMHKFRHLKTSLVFLLAYIGVKMLLSAKIHIPTPFSLAVIAGILGVGVVASLLSKAAPEDSHGDSHAGS
jgi:tellurite resistance protein TerC